MANQIARRLRETMTSQEVKLWVHLRSWRTRGFHFRRQDPREAYIVDFVCLKHRLIIEVDGGQHNFDRHHARDMARDARLSEQGFRILRFWNNEVDGNLSGVLQVIDAALMPSASPHPSTCGGHPPPPGEG
jgi:very-short-patch-repair endonuclease